MLDPDSLGRRLAGWAREANAPGLAVAAVRDRNVCYARGFGVNRADGAGTPVTPQTPFHIASTTKPLTGTAVMRLVERGVLELDRPVRDYVPWLRVGREDAAARITLRMLMSHTAGLPSGRYREVGPSDAGALRRWAHRDLPRYRLLAPPGAGYAYSNLGVSLAGYLAEVVTGQRFAELMRELVFGPLGMGRTTFDPAVALAHGLAVGHRDGGRGEPVAAPDPPVHAASAPAARAFSTVMDLAAFAAVHLDRGRHGGRPFLRPESVAAMHAPHAATGRDDTDGYGLTFGTDTYRGVRVVEHDGEGGWSTSQLVLAPDRGAAVVVLCNAHWPALTARVANHVLDRTLDLPDGPEDELPPSGAG
jgi:CubicO group peptidase (beta-lactamase class C family)